MRYPEVPLHPRSRSSRVTVSSATRVSDTERLFRPERGGLYPHSQRNQSTTLVLRRPRLNRRLRAVLTETPHTLLLACCFVCLVASIAILREPAAAVKVEPASGSELDVRPLFGASTLPVTAVKRAADPVEREMPRSALRSILAPELPLTKTRFGFTVPVSIRPRSMCTSHDFAALRRELQTARVEDLLMTFEPMDPKDGKAFASARVSLPDLFRSSSVFQIPESSANGKLAGLFLCTDPRRTGTCSGKPSAMDDPGTLRRGALLYFSPVQISSSGLVVPTLSEEFGAIDALGRIGSIAPRTKGEETAWQAAREIDSRQESLALRYVRGVFVMNLPVQGRGCPQ